MFWWLGLPAPLLWGTVMALLALLPVFGAAIIWLPAAIYLAVQGDWHKALLLVGWGAIVISLIDNMLYPVFVKDKLRLHTVPVFIVVLGWIGGIRGHRHRAGAAGARGGDGAARYLAPPHGVRRGGIVQDVNVGIQACGDVSRAACGDVSRVACGDVLRRIR